MSSKNTTNLVNSLLGMGGAVGAVIGSLNTPNPSGFDNTSESLTAIIIIIVLLAIFLCVLGAMATYKLTNSWIQVVLYLLLGNFYLIFAWIIYGMNGYKLVKMVRS